MECVASNPQEWVAWSDGQNNRPVVVSHAEQGGSVVVIADTHFAGNENLESAENSISDNIRFWRWLLSRVVTGQKPWNPPPNADKAGAAGSGTAKKDVPAADSKRDSGSSKMNRKEKSDARK